MTKHDEYFLEIEKTRADFAIKQLELREIEAKRKSFIRIFIGTFLGIVVSACMLFLFTKEIPDGNKDVVIALVSGLTGAFFGSVVTYYFGDSDSRSEQLPSIPESRSFAQSSSEGSEDDVASSKVQEPAVSEEVKKE